MCVLTSAHCACCVWQKGFRYYPAQCLCTQVDQQNAHGITLCPHLQPRTGTQLHTQLLLKRKRPATSRMVFTNTSLSLTTVLQPKGLTTECSLIRGCACHITSSALKRHKTAEVSVNSPKQNISRPQALRDKNCANRASRYRQKLARIGSATAAFCSTARLCLAAVAAASCAPCSAAASARLA